MNLKRIRVRSRSPKEQARIDKQLNSCINKFVAGEEMHPSEVELFCGYLSLNDDPRFDKVSNISLCNNYRFNNLFAIYGEDILQATGYIDFKGLVPSNRIEGELKELDKLRLEWENLLGIVNQTYPKLIVESVKEMREELAELDSNSEFNTAGILNKSAKYFHDRDYVIYKNRFFFDIATQVYEFIGNKEMNFQLAGKPIVITAFSIVHTLNRHYGQQLTKYLRDKTYHTEDINPYKFPRIIKNIYDCIDGSNLIIQKNADIETLIFIYRGTYYIIHNVYTAHYRSYEVRTFYPTSLAYINQEYGAVKHFPINGNLTLVLRV